MMKSRLLKGRPRLVPPKDYEASTTDNLWVEEKDSDITSISSRSSSSSEEFDDDSLVTEEEVEDAYHEEDSDDEYSRMERTVDMSPTEQTEKTEDDEDDRSIAQYNEVTPLFKAIDAEDWDNIITFLETGSWGWKISSLCAHFYNTSEKAAASQARTWVSARKKDVEGEITRLPLHAAIVKGAPYKVIDTLVRSYSKAVKSPDSDGNYPLHLAFSRGLDIQTTIMLVKEFEEAINIKNKRGLFPAECGNGRGVNELVRLCIDATKNHAESELTKEKGSLEEDRKQLLEVTKELMHLKKVVAERERNMTKENFLYQKQNLSSAISQLTKLKNDLDKHEDKVLKHHLAAEKKRMEGVLGELKKTKGELEMVKAEKGQSESGSDLGGDEVPADQMPTPPAQLPVKEKKKRSKKSKKPSSKDKAQAKEPCEAEAQPSTEPSKSEQEPEKGNIAPKAVAEEKHQQNEQESATKAKELVSEASSTPGAKESFTDTGSRQESMNVSGIDTAPLDDSRDPHDGAFMPEQSPSTVSGHDKLHGAQSPKKLKNVAARFKKKMHWRKEKQAMEAE